MSENLDQLLAASVLYRRLSADDLSHLARVAQVRSYGKGKQVFAEGDPSDSFYTVASGRVKVYKTTSAGKVVILEIFGPGDPLGALAAYDGRPFPATAVALEKTVCILLRREAFFTLLEQHPSLVRGLLAGFTQRLVQLTNRLAELSGGRVEPRLARLMLKLADDLGQSQRDGATLIPVRLKRQELADFTGTTVETCIRIMSRWAKAGILRTQREGFLLVKRGALEQLGAE